METRVGGLPGSAEFAGEDCTRHAVCLVCAPGCMCTRQGQPVLLAKSSVLAPGPAHLHM